MGIDPRERLEDDTTAFKEALRGLQAEMWTGFPAYVVSFDPDAITAVVQPVIQSTQRLQDGTTKKVTPPQLQDCPVFFPSGGGVTLTFPLKAGDEVWVNIANRCIDGWWQSSGIQPQMEHRMHDMSDGFCFPKVWSQPNVISNISTDSAQLRTDDGQAFLEVMVSGHDINVTTPATVTVNAQTVVVNASESATVNSPQVNLGGEGGPAVARIGDEVSGGVIITGSSKVFAT